MSRTLTRQRNQHHWRRLEKLANEGDFLKFYEEYASYLEEWGLISEQRQIIYKMAKAVVKELEELEHLRASGRD